MIQNGLRALLDEAEALRRLYPQVDLGRELGQEAFARLVRGGASLRTAYEYVHAGELLPPALACAMERGCRLAQREICACGLPPEEEESETC